MASARSNRPKDEEVVRMMDKLKLEGGSDNKILDEELRRIEENYLKPGDQEKLLKSMVQNVVQHVVYEALRKWISSWEFTGSSYELTSIPNESDFDVQFYLRITKADPARIVGSHHPGWSEVRDGPTEFRSGRGLCPQMVRQKFQSALGQFLAMPHLPSPVQDCEFTMSTSGPAVTLNVVSKSRRFRDFSIDIVASIKAEDIQSKFDLTAKPFDKSDRTAYPNLWRMSYSRMEKEEMRSYDTTGKQRRKLVLYRIFKVIRSKQPQLQRLPNYFYKNVIFKLANKYRRDEHWARNKLGERFKDFVKEVYDALENKRMPVFFNSKVNLLASESESAITSLKGYLQRIIRKGSYLDLVQVV